MTRQLGSNHIKYTISQEKRELKILRFLDRKKHVSVLDVGCGIGVLSSLIRAYGFKVHAFDISPVLMKMAYERMFRESLDLDIEHLKNLGLSAPNLIPAPKLWVGDAIRASNYLSGPYSVILCLGGALGYTSDPERVLTLMLETLEPRGRLYLELENSKSSRVLRSAVLNFFRFEVKEGLRALGEFLRASRTNTSPRNIELSNGSVVEVRVTQISMSRLEELALQSSCKIREVEGPAWLRDLIGSRSNKSNFIERYLSRFSPFNRLAQDIWIEIEKY